MGGLLANIRMREIKSGGEPDEKRWDSRTNMTSSVMTTTVVVRFTVPGWADAKGAVSVPALSSAGVVSLFLFFSFLFRFLCSVGFELFSVTRTHRAR